MAVILDLFVPNADPSADAHRRRSFSLVVALGCVVS